MNQKTCYVTDHELSRYLSAIGLLNHTQIFQCQGLDHKNLK